MCHDLGYLRGICPGDTESSFVINEQGDTVRAPRGASDAFLTPHHIERGKIFVRHRCAVIEALDAERIARAIELTRFPVPEDNDHAETDTEAGPAARGRSDRPARRPVLSAQAQRALPRVRRDRRRRAARLPVAGRSRRALSALFLAGGRALHRRCPAAPAAHRRGQAVDRQPVRPRVRRGASPRPPRPAARRLRAFLTAGSRGRGAHARTIIDPVNSAAAIRMIDAVRGNGQILASRQQVSQPGPGQRDMSHSTDPTMASPPAAGVTGGAAALTGAAAIRQQIASLPNGPGVYRMLDAKGEVLYVGKAKSLKKRVPAYTKPAALSARLQRMVALTRGLEVVTTANDVEALLLECNLIKRHRPPYNIVLRDDKSFPYIYVGKVTRRAAVPADRPPSRRQAQGLRLFRPVRVLGRGQRDARRAAARVPDRAPAPTASSRTAPGPACSTRSSAARRPASAASTPADYARLVEQTRAFLGGRSDKVRAAAAGRDGGRGRARSTSSRRPRSATASRRSPTSPRARASTSARSTMPT